MDEPRLRIAVQKSGRLTDPSLELLTRCGLRLARDRDRLVAFGENMPLDVLFVRDDDIPDLVRDGVCDLGLVGLDVLEENRLARAARERSAPLAPLRILDFGRCRLALAVPRDQAYPGPEALAGKRIATSHPRLLARHLRFRGVRAEIVTLAGAVEIAPRLGRADLVCDLVSSGATLDAHQLREVETVIESRAVLVRSPRPLPAEKETWAERLLRRLDGVEQVRESKYVMLHAPRAALDRIRRLLPGCECPTIIPLEDAPDRVAVHAVCRENVFWETLEDLRSAGASAVLVLPVEKMLA